jgi:hypothetical protein
MPAKSATGENSGLAVGRVSSYTWWIGTGTVGMNGWNRLFVVVAVLWAVAAPFWLMAEENRPVEQIFSLCSDAAYQRYGSSDSPKLDMDKYRVERDRCIDAWIRDHTGLYKVLGAMIGLGDWRLGAAAWGFILIPLVLLWIVGWGPGRVALWVAAGLGR